MINSILSAISIALDAEFGEGYETHMEEIKQGLNEPCFFVQCLNPTTELFLGKRYFRQNQFCIQYFPKDGKHKEAECNDVAERMTWCLEYINLQGDKIRATKIHSNVVDGVLNFFLNYDCFVYRVEVNESMDSFKSSTGTN